MQYQLEIDSILFHIPKSLCNSRGETEFSGIARWAEMGKQEERPLIKLLSYIDHDGMKNSKNIHAFSLFSLLTIFPQTLFTHHPCSSSSSFF